MASGRRASLVRLLVTVDSLPHLLLWVLTQRLPLPSQYFFLSLCPHLPRDQAGHCTACLWRRMCGHRTVEVDGMASHRNRLSAGQVSGRLPVRACRAEALSVYWGCGLGVKAGFLWMKKFCRLYGLNDSFGKLTGMNRVSMMGWKSILVK